MRLLLNVVMLLCYIHRHEGRLLHSVLGLQGKADPPQPGALVKHGTGAALETGLQGAARGRREAESPCSLRMLLLKVRELGLGYDSDETVLFKYCSGGCPHVRSNHELTLTNLMLRGALPPPLPGESWHSTPCCRPTHHEDLAFLDSTHRWHKVEQLSATACTCMN